MKRFAKILCLILTVSVILSLFVSCGNKKGEIVAVYNNIPVYESDVQDIINYNLINKMTSETTEDEIIEIMRDACKTYVKYKLLELDLAEKGYVIDEKALNETYKESKANLEEIYGYGEWCDMYQVSKDFLKEDLRRYELAELYYDYARESVIVTEEEAKAYYNANGIQYAEPAGYYWTSVLRQVLDITDETERAAAKAEMQSYADKINDGSMTLEKVKEELDAKYTQADGYFASIYSGEDFTSMSDMIVIEDEAALEAILKNHDEFYADRDLQADEDSEQYQNYMNYLGQTFKANVFYALQHMEEGEVYAIPLESFIGYYIVRLDKIETKNDFTPYEEVRDEIIVTLLDKKMQNSFVEYMTSLETKYSASYLFEIA